VPWQGQIVLACRKCQKKLKGDQRLGVLSKLKKVVKRHNKAHPTKQLQVINVPCMDLCPKHGVTVCISTRNCLSVLRSEEDIEKLALRRMPAIREA
jgi:predicted metal-binding protein